MGKEHVGVRESTAVVFALVMTKSFLDFPAVAARAGQSAAWMVVLVAAGWALVGVVLLAVLLERLPGKGLAEIAATMAGPTLGALLTLPLLTWVVLLTATTLRMFTENFITTILPHTPPSVIMLLTLAAMVYGASAGFEAISRATLFLVPIMSVVLIVIFLGLLYPQIRTDWLLPFWGPGPEPLLVRGIGLSGYLSEATILAIYGFAFRERRDFRKSAVAGLLLAATSLAILAAVSVSVFGPALAAQQPFPFYDLARMIYVGRFFQRLESVFLLFWGIAALIYLTVGLHASAVTVASALRLPLVRPLLYPLAVIVFASALIPENLTQAAAFNHWLRTSGGWIPLALSGLLLLLSLRRGGVTVLGGT